MITKQQNRDDIIAWFTGRLPGDWTRQAPQISVDDEEIVVKIAISPADLVDDADQSAVAEAAAGRMAAWREETREARIAIAKEAQQRFGRKVSWGVVVGDRVGLF